MWIWPDSSSDALEEAKASSIPLPDDIAQYLERIASEGDRMGFIRTVPYDYEVLVENLLDPAHVPFSHHGTSPSTNRSNGGALSMTQMPSVMPNAIASVEYMDSNFSPAGKARLEFVDPSIIMFTHQNKDSKKSNQALLLPLSPVRKGWSNVFIHSITAGRLSGHKPKMPIRSKLLFSMPVLIHMVNNSILDGDSVLLHIQEQNLRKERKSGWNPDAYFTPTSSDYMSVRFRNWLRKEGGGGPFGPLETREISPISRRKLLDRYESYTLQNKEAGKILAFVDRSIAVFKILGNAFLLMGGATVVYSMQKGIGFMWQTVICLCAFAVFSFLERFVRNKILPLFYFVDYVHADKD